MKGYLALEDGTILEGKAFGAAGENCGEVVFNTSMTGYQEVLTDPSYCYQIVTMTYPLIGNYGVNWDDEESSYPHVKGFIVKEFCQTPSNWRSMASLENYLAKHHIIGLSGLDTRFLTRRLRQDGTMKGIIAAGEYDPQELAAKAQASPGLSSQDLVSQVTCREPFVIPGEGYKVVLLDFGAKENIIRSLHNLGCQIHVLPAAATAQTILSLNPDGIMLSNGPGDPENVPYAVKTAAQLIAAGLPIFGICLGHQILGLALGAKTFKLKFGHRGANHPVQDLITKKVYITSQNHGFAVDRKSLAGLDVDVTHINLNDQTVEGIKHRYYPAFSVQYHPEAAPGPQDSAHLFDRFLNSMKLKAC